VPTPAQQITSDNLPLSDPISTLQRSDLNTPHDPRFASLDAALAKLLTTVSEHFLRWGGVIPASPLCVARYLAAHAETHAARRSPAASSQSAVPMPLQAFLTRLHRT
jgi:hypothetical protein